jgi:hypothetical protein
VEAVQRRADEAIAARRFLGSWRAGLGLLAHHAPLWGDASSWTELLGALRAFHDRWTAPARAAGWSDVQLFGLDPNAPRARLSRMGGAFLACLPGRQVLGGLSVYCPEAGGTLAWEVSSSRGSAIS